MSDAAERFADNPFHVLELPPTATRAEVERAGQKWLAMLEVGVKSARLYPTPVGPRARTPELVRGAMAELRDPDKRIVHEMWCASAVTPEPAPSSVDEDVAEPTSVDASPFDALAALAWVRR